MRFMSGDRVWKGGDVMNPVSGNHYSGKIQLEDANTLVARIR